MSVSLSLGKKTKIRLNITLGETTVWGTAERHPWLATQSILITLAIPKIRY